MRQFAAAACLCLLMLGCDNAFREEATFEGAPTSSWVVLAKDRDEDVDRRYHAIEVLGDLGLTETDQTVPALAEVLADPEPRIRFVALQSLAKLAPKASKAEPAVGRAINDKNKDVMKQALRTFKAIQKAKPGPLNPES